MLALALLPRAAQVFGLVNSSDDSGPVRTWFSDQVTGLGVRTNYAGVAILGFCTALRAQLGRDLVNNLSLPQAM
jgi:hypothetical protein